MSELPAEYELVEEEAGIEEPLFGPDGAMVFGYGRECFLTYWLEKLGVTEAEIGGSAVLLGEGCSVALLDPLSGDWLTPKDIIKKTQGVSTVTAFKKERA